MERRAFLRTAGSSAALGAVATTASAQSSSNQPIVRWRMATSWPKSLDTMYGSAEALARRVAVLTDGRFEIKVSAAGEVVPPLQVFDAVQQGSIEACHTLSSYFIGKNPALAFDAGIAFGLNARQQNAWMYSGGGLELLREVYKAYGITNFPVGNVGVQMGGWYRKEIRTVEDLKGLKFRIGGFGGMIMSKLGVVPQQIPTGDIYSSLERGTIDAAEWIGPHDDEKLGFHKVAKFYYAPGWWEGSAQITGMVNTKQWEALPKAYQEAFETACTEQNLLMMAHYDQSNPAALKRLLAQGTQLRQFPRPVMDACYKATEETLAEMAGKSAEFKRILEVWTRFRDDQNQWFRWAENALDSYRYSRTASGG
jgi:TRAP-type mannitol/chloroaromatic compound transport system substrate-binding protein